MRWNSLFMVFLETWRSGGIGHTEWLAAQIFGGLRRLSSIHHQGLDRLLVCLRCADRWWVRDVRKVAVDRWTGRRGILGQLLPLYGGEASASRERDSQQRW